MIDYRVLFTTAIGYLGLDATFNHNVRRYTATSMIEQINPLLIRRLVCGHRPSNPPRQTVCLRGKNVSRVETG